MDLGLSKVNLIRFWNRLVDMQFYLNEVRMQWSEYV